MSALAQMVKQAALSALTKVSLESQIDELLTAQASMEALVDEHTQMLNLADGLETTMVSLEAIEDLTARDFNTARAMVGAQLRLAGMGPDDINNIIPSMEAADPVTSWEKFKAFLSNLWELIKRTAAKLYEFVRTVLKQSTAAEKIAIAQLRQMLRRDIAGARNGMTRSAQVQLTAAHRFLFNPPPLVHSAAGLTVDAQLSAQWRGGNAVNGPDELLQNVANFVAVRNAVEVKFTDYLSAQMKLLDATMKRARTLVINDDSAFYDVFQVLAGSVRQLAPENVMQAIGLTSNPTALAYDRAVLFTGGSAASVSWDSPEAVRDYLLSLGMHVVQVADAPKEDSYGTFPAMRWDQITRTLNKAVDLIDTHHSADSERRWIRLQDDVNKMYHNAEYIRKRLMDRPDVNEKVMRIAETSFRFCQCAVMWVSAPYRQLGAVNISVVRSLIEMARTQLANYEDVQGAGLPA